MSITEKEKQEIQKKLQFSSVLSSLYTYQKEDLKLLNNWFDNTLTPSNQKPHYEVLVSCQLDKIQFNSLFDATSFDDIIKQQSSKHINSKIENEIYSEFLERNESIEILDWLLFYQDFLSKGWGIKGEIPINKLLASNSKNKILNKIHFWSYKYPSARISKYLNSNDSNNQFSEIILHLNNRSLNNYSPWEELFEELGFAWIDVNFNSFISSFTDLEIDCIITYTQEFVQRIGLVFHHPTREFMFTFFDMNNCKNEDKIARIEGILKVDKPEKLIYSMYSDSWKNELFYIL